MIEFDFRNGPLRRKYDGLKYAIKKIEEILYELSLLDDVDGDPVSKRPRVQDISPGDLQSQQRLEEKVPLVDAEELNAIRIRYEEQDKLREDVIKLSRDVQKLSKQAIFSVHRNDVNDASAKCTQALTLINKILKDIEFVCKL